MARRTSSLMTRFRAGEPEAVRAVHAEYAGAVRTVARSIVGNSPLVDDIVQETFVKAWRAAARFDQDREVGPWLYTIARRTAIDAVRREQRPTLGGHDDEVDVGVAGPDFERTWEAFEVRRALDSLPPDEREIVRLSHFVGVPHAEIASRLGIPVGTVKSRSARAHRRLGAALGHVVVNQNEGQHRRDGGGR